MTDSRREDVLDARKAPTSTMRRFGSVVVVVSAVALIGAFIPGITLVALVIGVVGLALGIICLAMDPGFNLPALAGTLAASAAVSLAIIMGIAYGA